MNKNEAAKKFMNQCVYEDQPVSTQQAFEAGWDLAIAEMLKAENASDWKIVSPADYRLIKNSGVEFGNGK